jgi:hypothetical protein
MPSGTSRSAASCRCHIRWNWTGKHPQPVPGQLTSLGQDPAAVESLQQDRGDLRHPAPPVPVAQQPPRVRDHHRIQVPGPEVIPACGLTSLRGDRELLLIPFRDPVIGTDIDDHGPPVIPAGEEVRRMPPDMIVFVPPAEPERLRRDRPHPGSKSMSMRWVPLSQDSNPT